MMRIAGQLVPWSAAIAACVSAAELLYRSRRARSGPAWWSSDTRTAARAVSGLAVWQAPAFLSRYHCGDVVDGERQLSGTLDGTRPSLRRCRRKGPEVGRGLRSPYRSTRPRLRQRRGSPLTFGWLQRRCDPPLVSEGLSLERSVPALRKLNRLQRDPPAREPVACRPASAISPLAVPLKQLSRCASSRLRRWSTRARRSTDEFWVVRRSHL